jgi:biopolymer transport protein ExbD
MGPKKHRKQRRDSDVPVSAFSDIAFLLIIFFILATTLVQVSGVVTEIPSGEQAQTKQEDETPTVQLQGDRVLLNEKHVDMKEFRQRLTKMKLHQKAGDDKVVLLEASGNVTYQTYFDVMASISAAGGVTAILQEE